MILHQQLNGFDFPPYILKQKSDMNSEITFASWPDPCFTSPSWSQSQEGSQTPEMPSCGICHPINFFMFIFGWAKLKSITTSINADTRWCFLFSDIQKLTHNAHKQKTIFFEYLKMKVLLTSGRASLQLYYALLSSYTKMSKNMEKSCIMRYF